MASISTTAIRIVRFDGLSNARLIRLLRSPRAIVEHLTALFKRRLHSERGHNAAGWMKKKKALNREFSRKIYEQKSSTNIYSAGYPLLFLNAPMPTNLDFILTWLWQPWHLHKLILPVWLGRHP